MYVCPDIVAISIFVKNILQNVNFLIKTFQRLWEHDYLFKNYMTRNFRYLNSPFKDYRTVNCEFVKKFFQGLIVANHEFPKDYQSENHEVLKKGFLEVAGYKS